MRKAAIVLAALAFGVISCNREPDSVVTHRGRDGRPDQWEYRIDAHTCNIAIDTNGDGRPDASSTSDSGVSPARQVRREGCARQGRPEFADEFSRCLSPVGELVVSIPAPCCDHRKHQDPAFAEQPLIGGPVEHAHLFGHVSEIELDGPAATVSRSMNSRPFFVLSTLPGCGSPCRSCSGRP